MYMYQIAAGATTVNTTVVSATHVASYMMVEYHIYLPKFWIARSEGYELYAWMLSFQGENHALR